MAIIITLIAKKTYAMLAQNRAQLTISVIMNKTKVTKSPIKTVKNRIPQDPLKYMNDIKTNFSDCMHTYTEKYLYNGTKITVYGEIWIDSNSAIVIRIKILLITISSF